MNTQAPIPDITEGPNTSSKGIQINFKRVADRAIRYWYIILLSLIISVSVAYLMNRYSTRIYPVKASIIIRESEENVGAKFLYNNELLTEYRNFYNEIYIMKSYPLLQEVVEELGFDVSYFREGDIKTTEYYEPNFPLTIKAIANKDKRPYGKSFYFKVIDQHTYSLQYKVDDDQPGKEFSSLQFNDTVKINGYQLFVTRKADVSELFNKTLVVRFNNPLSLAKSYSSRLKIGWAMTGSSVVDLEINGSVIQKEIDFLSKFIERYQDYDVEKKNKMVARAIMFLDNQLGVIGDSLEHYEDQVEDFKRRNVITELAEETNRLYLKLQDYENQKFQYRLLDNYFTYISQLLEQNQYEGIFTPQSVGITDGIITQLITTLIEEQGQVNLYKTNTTRGVLHLEDNPEYQAKLKKIQFLKADILKTIENNRSTQKINIKFINDQIKLVEDQLAKLPSTERELVGIQRNYSLRENLYIFLLQKRTEAGLSMASTTSDIVVVNPPMAGGAISPKTMQNLMIGVGIGLLVPLSIFILLEILNNRIQSKDDIENMTSAPVIGAVGHNPASDALIVYNKPRSAMAESFRSLRSNLNYFTGSQDHQIFMVTSSIPGEGKSFTTLNLATVYALAGKRTVIVGADLRKPKLYDELGLNNTIGLSQYLSGMATKEEIIQTSSVDSLYLIASGPMPPNPSELLLRPAMEELINYLRTEFDYIIIDTPPLSLVTDAFVLSKHVNHTLFVIRQDYTPKEALRSFDDFYKSGRLLRVSVLFNDLRKSGLGYGYGGYSYGYGYGSGYQYGGYYYGRKKKKNGNDYYQE
ncbi:polysaccharide biosynthesis tyrosine autokinase [Ohtaekwangia koreensis]|uniref:Capsular exopolysaccharide family n=1 Tax=Ohtaekwangia koreensis TaxID=688867 RepID=A0A1T5M480_9BACT|nr:tyrosine-protein kinase [Ohtaekwangia koreensis]SKC83042.1 capsular exopolysaccharide family [Ohtaekwangia koreensis]